MNNEQKKQKREKKWASQEGECIVCMQEMIDTYWGCKWELAVNLNKSLRNLNQVQRNFKFRSWAKTSKEGNNGLDKKDWILTVSTLDEDVFKGGNWGVFNIVVSYTERFKDQINYTLLAGESNQSDSKTKYFFTSMTARQNYKNLHLAQLFSCSDSVNIWRTRP